MSEDGSPKDPGQSSAQVTDNAPGVGKQLLLADDMPANLETLISTLEPCGYQISVAMDGERALKLAREILPDVMLLDISMPGKNGFDVCKALKDDPLTEHIPVIFITAGTDNLTEAYKLGAADCLIRPLNEAHLLARVRNCIRIQELAEQKILSVENEHGERFHSLVNTVPDGIVTINESFLIETFNPAAEKLFGFSADEVIGQNVNVLMPAPYHDEHDGYVERYLKSGIPKIIGLGREVVGKRKDGTVFPMELAVGEFSMGGSRMFAGIIRDITERKQAQAEKDELNAILKFELGEKENALERLKDTQGQLVQTEKMAALGELVAGVSHEINTPIGVGVTAASTLSDRVKEFTAKFEADSMQRSDLESFLEFSSAASEILLNNLHRAADLVRSFKQVAVDQVSNEQRVFNVKDYIDEVLLSLTPKLKRTSHEFVIDCPEDLVIQSYPGALAQILTNLVFNAILHAFEDSEAGTISIKICEYADNIELVFSDNGCGIPEDHISRIFDPFFTTRRNTGGSGLGLHLVYNLISRVLNGHVTVKSTVGEGTTFTIKYPATVIR